jgi:hypothetical protein
MELKALIANGAVVSEAMAVSTRAMTSSPAQTSLSAWLEIIFSTMV